MKIYIGKNKGSSKRISLYDLIHQSLANNSIQTDSGRFGDDSGAWVGILKSDEGKQVTVNLMFNCGNLDEIVDVGVYEAKIITIVDEERAKKII